MQYFYAGRGFLLLELIISLAILALCSSVCAVALVSFLNRQRERVACMQALAVATSYTEQCAAGLPARYSSYSNSHFEVKKVQKLVHIVRLKDQQSVAVLLGAGCEKM